MAYHQFTITVPNLFKDAVVRRLMTIGSLGVIDRKDGIVAYFPDSVPLKTVQSELEIVQAILTGAGAPLVLNVEHAILPDRDWNASWKKTFKPLDVGERFTILPPWEKPRPGRTNLVIEPGMAFGTGHHETTRSCLLLMEKYSAQVSRQRFLDLGTGTGLLALAAVHLGFQEVVGADFDPLAISAARKNAGLNGVKTLTLIEGGIEEAGSDYDMIAANLISGTLVELAGGIAERMRSGAVAILSGILKGQEGEVTEAFENAGCRFREKLVDGKWVSLVCGRSE
jgi:ribosomal protein L11 methyltransferase